jgi:hypothetical protein
MRAHRRRAENASQQDDDLMALLVGRMHPVRAPERFDPDFIYDAA